MILSVRSASAKMKQSATAAVGFCVTALCVSVLGIAHGEAADCESAAVTVANAGFEEGEAGTAKSWWLNPSGKFRFEDRSGRSGTRALAYDNTDDAKNYTIPSQGIKLKAGVAYRFGAWVRTENLAGGGDGASVCLEWYDVNRKYLGGSYAEGVKGTSDGWVKIEFVSPRIPANAASMLVAPFVRKGMMGKAWFDDVFVEPYVPRPVQTLLCDAYRNSADAGVVAFCAALDQTEAEAASRRGVFVYRDAAGAERRKSAERLTRYAASVRIPISGLAVGSQRISFELHSGDGTVAGRAELEFVRRTKPECRRVHIDRSGRTIVDGKPFFPLGTFWTDFKSADDVELYAKSPFNCIMPYWGHRNPKMRELMDLCHARGVRVIPNLKDFWDYGDVKQAPARTTEFVNRLKDHPALLAWYVVDESPISKLPQLAARRDLVERLDPEHPTWGCFYQHDQILNYLPSCDVIGTDPYPIGNGDGNISFVTKSTRDAYIGTRGCRALWQVPQMFDWAAYRKDDVKARPPTEAEMRNMAWQCIANGANGLVWYSFFDVKSEPNGVPFARRWEECCRVGAEIRKYENVLLSPTSEVLECFGTDANVSARTYSQDGCDWLLAVNSASAVRTVRIPLCREYSAAKPEFGPATALIGKVVEIRLAPLEPALVRLERDR